MNFDPTAIPELIGRFHPLLLHFPIGLLAWAAVIELICVYRKRQVPAGGPDSLAFVVPGAAFAIMASFSGWLLADPNDPDTALAWHRWLGVSTALLAVLTCWVGIVASRGSRVAGTSYRLSLFLCVPVLMGAGHIGGELKWGDGFVEKGFEKVFFAENQSPAQLNASQTTERQVIAAETTIPQELAAENLFHEKIQPLFEKHCVSCHGPDKAKGKLRLDQPDDLRDLTRDFPLVVAGQPQESLLLELVMLGPDEDDRMPPPEEPGLSAEELTDLEAWVTAGAPWPGEGPRGPVGLKGALEVEPRRKPLKQFAGEALEPTPDDHEESEEPVEDGKEKVVELTPDEHFLQKVQPLLQSRCVECHGEKKQKGGLRLDLPAAAFADREFPTIVKGSLEDSELILRIHLADDDDERMPPLGERLTESEAGIFEKWILDGAPWPESGPVASESDESQTSTVVKAVTVMPGQLPDHPLIRVTDAQITSEIEAALSSLEAAGVRAGLVSGQDSSHEAIFRLLGKDAGDSAGALLKGLETVLVRLDLAGTSITEKTVSQLWKFRRIRTLNLSETSTTDDQLATLASLPELTVLNLFGTEVSDMGLDILREMDQLRRVYLWRSAVTPEGAAKLSKARPDLLVDIGVPLPKPDQETKDPIEKEVDQDN